MTLNLASASGAQEKAWPTSSVIEQIHRHVSIRKYKSDPLPREWVEGIVAAGQRAATSSNFQMYAVIAVTDQGKRADIARLCGGQAHVAEAPVVLVWCADLSKLDHAARLRGLPHHHDYVENFTLATVDSMLAAQNAALAAESLGLGTCYIGAIRSNARDIIRLLRLPRLMFPIAGMTIGWPNGHATRHPRLPLPAVLHWEEYSDTHINAALHAYDQDMARTGIYKNRQAPVPGKPDQLEAYGWLEHTARRVMSPLRVELREVLREQGFELN